MTTPRYAPDGSPVALYLRLSGETEADLIDAQLHASSHVLELGCGAGRLTHELVRRGHRVTAVDNSPEMLTHIRGAETVLADIVGLDLGTTFDAVVLWSHMINTADPTVRDEFMATCRRHLSPDGIALVLRYEPGWVRTVKPSRNDDGHGMISELHSIEHDGDQLRARVAWEFDNQRYEQPFAAAELDDDALMQLADATGLRVVAVLDPRRMLIRLETAR